MEGLTAKLHDGITPGGIAHNYKLQYSFSLFILFIFIYIFIFFLKKKLYIQGIFLHMLFSACCLLVSQESILVELLILPLQLLFPCISTLVISEIFSLSFFLSLSHYLICSFPFLFLLFVCLFGDVSGMSQVITDYIHMEGVYKVLTAALALLTLGTSGAMVSLSVNDIGFTGIFLCLSLYHSSESHPNTYSIYEQNIFFFFCYF